MDQLPARETLPALLRRSLLPPREGVLYERVNGAFTPIGSAELLSRVERLACAIRDAGLNAGDRVALISADRIDWVAADLAILFAGCVVVPIFPTQALDQVGYILRDSEAKLIFADTPRAAERLRGADVPLPPIVVFDASGEGSLADFEARGERARSDRPQWPSAFEGERNPDDLAVLIYTSGTTGDPKGVMLSHYNLVSNTVATFTHAMGIIVPGSVVLSVLPFSHIYEHMIMYGYMTARASHYICHDVNELLPDLRDVRPIAMTAVPRIFERMIAGVTAKSRLHGGLQARLVPWALEIGRAYMTARTRKTRISPILALQYRIAEALVFRKLRKTLGLDRIRFMVSGSAPLHFDTAMTMRGIGVTIVEGYGPTECSPVITANTYADNHYGTVGKPVPGVEIRIAPDGEILARGPNVMLGYYKNAAATAEAIVDGWYHTGDIGEIVDGGYLRITDRKKELFKTSGGKFVAPSRVESAIKRSVYVNQVMLVGDGRAHPAALVSPNWEMVRAHLDIPKDVPPSELAQRADVLDFMTQEVRAQTEDLAKFEQIRRIAILPRELTVEEGDLSPTLKVKRRVVEAKFAPLVEHLYDQYPEPAHA